MSRTNRWRPLPPLTLLLAACSPDTSRIDAHTVRTQAEAGSVTVSVTSVEPWADVAERLQPNFKLATGDDALSKTLPITQQALTRTLDALSAQAQIGLPSTTRTVTENTNTDAAGKTTQTRTEEQKEAPGEAPKAAAELLQRSLKDMTDGLAASFEYGKDPVLQYQTATALFQEVQLLNSYLNSAALQSCFTPYLVRLQIGVTPYARRQPYDVYQRVSFFVGEDEVVASSAAASIVPSSVPASQSAQHDRCETFKGHQPRVVPLVVTDNLELSREHQAQQVSRQLGLALSGIVSNVALAGQINRLTESLDAIEGNSLNSLTSVTRVNDSTFMTRLGAANDASVKDYGRAMVARNYNVTVVVLVPDSVARKERPWLSVLGKTEIRNVNTGELVDQSRYQVAIPHLKQMQKTYQLPGWSLQNDQELYEAGLSLAYLVSSNNTNAFCEQAAQAFGVDTLPAGWSMWSECLSRDPTQIKQIGQSESDLVKKLTHFENNASTFWNDMSGLAAGFELSSAWLELPRVDAPALPPQQSVAVLDDGKEATIARLWGGYGFTSPEVGAWLRVHVKKAPAGAKADQTTYDFAPTAVNLPAGTRNLELRYPSLAFYGFKPDQVSFVELWVGLATDNRYGLAPTSSVARDGVLCRLPATAGETKTARSQTPKADGSQQFGDPVPELRIAIPNTLPTMTYQAAEGRLVSPNEPCTARIYRGIWTPQPAKKEEAKPATAAAKQDPKPSADAAVGKT